MRHTACATSTSPATKSARQSSRRYSQTAPEAYNLRELSDYVEAQGFSWPVRMQTILDWISAAALHCGLPGQKMRLIHARCFLRHLKASVPDTEVPGIFISFSFDLVLSRLQAGIQPASVLRFRRYSAPLGRSLVKLFL
jgi:hypothetical protein